MPIYIVNSVTNEIVARFAAEQPIRQDQLLAEDQNRACVEDPGDYDRQTHIYIDGAFVTIPEPSAAIMLAAAKDAIQGQLLANVNQFIETKPDGKTRYDTNLKLNLLDWRDEIRQTSTDPSATPEQLAWAAAAEPLIDSVKAWINDVQQTYLYDRKPAINAAEDMESLEAIDVSYAWFEERFGLAGTEHPDPDIYTSDIAMAGQ